MIYLINRKCRRVPCIDSWFIDINNHHPDFRAHVSNDTTRGSTNVACTNAADLLNFKHGWTRRETVRLLRTENLKKPHCTFITLYNNCQGDRYRERFPTIRPIKNYENSDFLKKGNGWPSLFSAVPARNMEKIIVTDITEKVWQRL